MSIIRDFIHKVTEPKNQTNFVGAESFRTRNPYILDCYESDKYASIYPSIKAISNEFMKITPYAINGKGESLKDRAPIGINALYNPNQLDSSVAFREKLAVMNLTHRMTYVLIWRREGGVAKPGGEITENNIGGFTFLENPAINIRDKKTYYNIGSQEFSEDNVMAIPGGVDPSGLYRGYAPGIASARWATLDEYIADFQQGFFENGAVPAGQFIIIAPTKIEFDDIVDTLQAKHRGAGKNNNITYTHRPTDATGKPVQAQIEWIPFQTPNKDIDFKNLFEQANKRIDSTFGVPASIRGVGENNNYATARVDQQNFLRFTVDPLALRIYTQITHELNRITGGLGYAITYTLDFPAVADEEKVQEETKQIRDERAQKWIDLGYSISSVNKYLSSNNLEDLEIQVVAEDIEDKPDVDDGNEVKESPNPDDVDGVTPLNKVAAKSTNPKETEELLIPLKSKLSDEEKLEKAARALMKSQVERTIDELSDELVDQEAPTEDELEEFVVAMMLVITGILLVNGKDAYEAAVAKAGISLSELQGFMLTESAESAYQGYLRQVGTSYGNDTAASLQKVLADSAAEGLSRRDTEKALRNVMDTDDWRIKRLARTELNNSQNIGKLEGMKSLAAETNASWEKTIDHTGKAPCPLCASQEGIWTPLEQPLWSIGQAISTINDKDEQVIYINDWQTNEANDYHPNGKGVLTFRRVLP